MSRLKTFAGAAMACVVLAFGWFSYQTVIVKPFPFLDVKYVERRDFESLNMGVDDVRYSSSISALDEREMKRVRRTLNLGEGLASMEPFEVARLFVATVRDIMADASGNDIRALDEIVEIDGRFLNICSEYSRMLSVVAQAYGFDARVVWMNGHTSSEIHFPSIGWAHVDAMGNIAFKDRDGEMLSLMEYRTLEGEASAVRIDETERGGAVPEYHPLSDKLRAIYADNDLYMVLSGDSLFSYHEAHRNPLSVILSALNVQPLGYGVQYVDETVDMPKVGNWGLDFYRHFQ